MPKTISGGVFVSLMPSTKTSVSLMANSTYDVLLPDAIFVAYVSGIICNITSVNLSYFDGVNLVQNGIYSTNNPDELSKMKIYEGAKYGYKSWKANTHGVDVNWNYDKDWFEKRNKNPRGSTGFNGDMPNTEPETIAVSNYVDSFPFEAVLSFHTQGEILYWADNPENPSNIPEMIKADTGFAAYEEKADGMGGSFFDYVYRKYFKPTITVELCPYIGNFPYPDKDFDRIWTPAKNVLLIVGNELINQAE